MRRLIVTVYASLDGVIDGEGNAALETWQLPFADEEFERRAEQQLDTCDALLLGRRTYQGFAETWPTMAGDNGIADRLNSLPKHVASTTLTEPLAWNATLLKGSVPGAVAELKRASGGDILLYGCGDLAYTLARHGLIDEVQV
jgi:dihydrofolate reductase